MRRVLLSALFTATLLAPAAQADDVLFFQDDFNRADEIPITSWTPFGTGFGGPLEEPLSLGANQVNLEEGGLVFTYLSGGDPSLTVYNAASVFTAAAMVNPPTIRFTFTPGDAGFDYVFGVSFPESSMCLTNLTFEPYLGTPALVPCSTEFTGRITNQSAPLRMAKRETGGSGVVRESMVPAPSSSFGLILGGISDGYYIQNATIPEFNIVAGVTYQVEYSIAFTEFMGIQVSLSITDGVNSASVTAGDGGGAPEKTSRMAQFAPVPEPGADYAFFIADAGHNSLDTLDGSSSVSSASHRFDDVVITESHIAVEPEPEPLYSITAEVEAKGKFKKQPIDIRKKGVLQATVYGDNSGDDALDVENIRLDSVTFGATGSETTTPALGVRYAQVDKDGVLDAIFDFAKSATVTPCGTTSVTITGDFDVPDEGRGAFARFSGADNRVKVTGCPRTKNRN